MTGSTASGNDADATRPVLVRIGVESDCRLARPGLGGSEILFVNVADGPDGADVGNRAERRGRIERFRKFAGRRADVENHPGARSLDRELRRGMIGIHAEDANLFARSGELGLGASASP